MIVRKTINGYYVFKTIMNKGRKSKSNQKQTDIHLLEANNSGHRCITMTTIYFPKELLGARIRLKVEVLK